MFIHSLFIKQKGLALTLKRHSVVQKTETSNCSTNLNCRQFSPLQYQDISELVSICWYFILCVKFMSLPWPQQDPSVSIPHLSIIVFSPFLPIHPNRHQDYLTSPWYNPFKSIARIAWDISKCWKIQIVQFIEAILLVFQDQTLATSVTSVLIYDIPPYHHKLQKRNQRAK